MPNALPKLVINGGNKISGELRIQGAKNSALPILAATLLTRGKSVIHNCPKLSDVYSALRILSDLGCTCSRQADAVIIDSEGADKSEVSESLMRQMRSSIVFLGAVVGRVGKCRLSFPGGCELGPRPIDMHISALKQMGVKILEEYGTLYCTTPAGLRGAKINLSFPSVGATENIILAAVTAKGETVIRNAAREPEIADLAEFLNASGAKISGAGTGTVVINGVRELKACEYTVMPDRIAAATYLSAAAITGGDITLAGVRNQDLDSVIPVFEEMGCSVFTFGEKIYLSARKPLSAVKTIRTMPYPGFPTDAQAIVMAPLCLASGTSVIIETIFENRYRHVDELVRMGARIKAEGKVAVVEGVKRLYGASLISTDLRGGAALVIAALAAQGESVIGEIRHIDRGYDSIESALSSLGASIKRVQA